MIDNLERETELLKKSIWWMKNLAAEALVTIGEPAVQPLIECLKDNEWVVNVVAAKALGRIGDTRAVEPLIGCLKDEDWYVRWAAAAALKAIAKNNRKVASLYPDLICFDCCMKAIRQNIRISLFHSCNFVFCRSCMRSEFLKTGFRVFGIIGGNLEDSSHDKETLYLQLWDEEKKKARNADIDVLEIRGVRKISYSWAINAVVNALKNDTFHPSDYLKKIPVHLKDNPPLQVGDRQLINGEFKCIVKMR